MSDPTLFPDTEQCPVWTPVPLGPTEFQAYHDDEDEQIYGPKGGWAFAAMLEEVPGMNYFDVSTPYKNGTQRVRFYGGNDKSDDRRYFQVYLNMPALIAATGYGLGEFPLAAIDAVPDFEVSTGSGLVRITSADKDFVTLTEAIATGTAIVTSVPKNGVLPRLVFDAGVVSLSLEVAMSALMPAYLKYVVETVDRSLVRIAKDIDVSTQALQRWGDLKALLPDIAPN